MFSSAGQLNAYDRADAIQQIVKLAGIINNQPANAAPNTTSPSYSEEAREALLKKALQTVEGKVALGQAMANPIRRNLDYQGVGRKALVVDPLPQGALPIYDKDIDVAATLISSNGAVPESRIQGDRVTVPEFEVVSNPTVRIAEVKRRRFNVIDRAQQKARMEIQAQEDANIFAALDFASTQENLAQTIAGTGLTLLDLLAVKKQIDRWDLLTVRYFMNINEFTDILAWTAFNTGGGSGAYGNTIDMVTQREILQTGLFGHIWGADIIVSKIVPAGTIYGCADAEFVGVMPIRQDIEVLPADEPKKLLLGWVISEIIGVGIVNPRATAKASKP